MPRPPAEPAATAPASAPEAPALELARPYAFARGFSYRRESFGGILYHYEGIQPDPRVTFVDNGFLLDVLDALAAHPDVTPAELLASVAERFALGPAERNALHTFFVTLIARGALVPV